MSSCDYCNRPLCYGCPYIDEEENEMITINEGNYGETAYIVSVGTGTAWLKQFRVYAYNETEAVDLVADYCEEQELDGLYADYYDLADCSETGQSVDEYVAEHNLTCCGNHGIYLEIVNIEEVK